MALGHIFLTELLHSLGCLMAATQLCLFVRYLVPSGPCLGHISAGWPSTVPVRPHSQLSATRSVVRQPTLDSVISRLCLGRHLAVSRGRPSVSAWLVVSHPNLGRRLATSQLMFGSRPRILGRISAIRARPATTRSVVHRPNLSFLGPKSLLLDRFLAFSAISRP